MGWHAAYELEAMARAGMTPMEIIVSATKTAADLMLLDHLGTVAPTKSADFVVLNANPLDDIHNTQKIDAVIMRGRYYSRKELNAMLKPLQ